MKVIIPSFGNGENIPVKHAFCKPGEEGPVDMSDNINPHIQWTDIPGGTKSFAVICVDPDVPSKPDDVNQEGKTVPKDLPRVDFYHWVLADIPASISEIPEGADSKSVTPRGKDGGQTDFGRRGKNNYTQWFEGDDDMEGEYFGYDGPCPPWNDEIIHHYHYKVFALDVEKLDLDDNFDGPAALEAMKGHILGQAEWIGTYTLNKNLIG